MSVKLAAAAILMSLGLAAAAPQARAGAPMPTGALVVPPGGFIGFCARHMQDCTGASPGPVLVAMGHAERGQLETVQEEVNAAIRWRDDPEHLWDYPHHGVGDCNKFALEKRRELIALGWPAAALLLTTAVTETNEAHLVLVVRTSDGDLVLDNRSPKVVDWTRLPYRWQERQSETSPSLWVAIQPQGVAIADAKPAGGVGTP